MRASVIHRFGPPEVLVSEEVAEPHPGPGQVHIEVELANVTFVETQVRAGKAPRPEMLPSLPAILGNGVAGRVTAVGDGASKDFIGRRVIASLTGTGGYAERAVAPVDAPIEIPEQLSARDALALLADGRTAVLLVRAAGLQRGETVLVEAAAGGVGSLLVQLARNAGAHVVGAAGGERKLQVAHGLGADVVVDYTRSDWTQRLSDGVDVVFDGVGGPIGETAFGLLRPGGRFCAFGMASGAFARVTEIDAAARQVQLVRGVAASPEEIRGAARAALDEAVAGRLKPLIGQSFALKDAAAAHRSIETRRSVGKTLLTIRDVVT